MTGSPNLSIGWSWMASIWPYCFIAVALQYHFQHHCSIIAASLQHHSFVSLLFGHGWKPWSSSTTRVSVGSRGCFDLRASESPLEETTTKIGSVRTGSGSLIVTTTMLFYLLIAGCDVGFLTMPHKVNYYTVQPKNKIYQHVFSLCKSGIDDCCLFVGWFGVCVVSTVGNFHGAFSYDFSKLTD